MPAKDTLECPFHTPSGSTRRRARGSMYGLLFESIQLYIKQDYGEDVWQTVLETAGLPQVVFQLHKTYPDEWMVNLARATAEVLNIQVNDVMFYFGTTFVNFCSKFSYDKILRRAGRNYRDFLNEIDNVHETMRFSYPKMQSPSFIVQSEDRNGCVLIYRSMRTGFTYYVIGQLVQCAQRFFDVITKRCIMTQYGIVIHYVLYSGFTWFRDWDSVTGKVVVKAYVMEEIVSNEGCHVTFRLTFDNKGYVPPAGSGNTINHHLDLYPEVKSSTFFKIFPFCMVFNSSMHIIGCGASLTSLLKSQNILGSKVTDLVSLRRPLVDFTWNNTLCLQRVIYEVEWKNIVDRSIDKPDSFLKKKHRIRGKKLLLRGQMKYIKDWDAMAYLCTPLLGDLDDMLKAGVYMNDLNMFDSSRDLVMTEQKSASDLEYTMEKQTAWSRQIEVTLKRLDVAQLQSEKLINSMLTKSIADRLKRGDDPLTTCEAFPQVTILFSYLVHFSDICTDGTPMQVVQCIQNVTEVYDKIVDKYSLFKVETLGDGVYMVAGGVPDKISDHAQKVAGLALELVENAMYVKNPLTGEGMQIRIGIDTGSVVAGIVGKRTPQYCLFGDTVNTASRMQTNSEPGRIHVTEPCHTCLQSSDYVTIYRGRIRVKGKGEMRTYWLAGRRGLESTREMCRMFKEEHVMRKKMSHDQGYDLHAMTSSASTSNLMAVCHVTDEDTAEFESTLAGVLEEDESENDPSNDQDVGNSVTTKEELVGLSTTNDNKDVSKSEPIIIDITHCPNYDQNGDASDTTFVDVATNTDFTDCLDKATNTEIVDKDTKKDLDDIETKAEISDIASRKDFADVATNTNFDPSYPPILSVSELEEQTYKSKKSPQSADGQAVEITNPRPTPIIADSIGKESTSVLEPCCNGNSDQLTNGQHLDNPDLKEDGQIMLVTARHQVADAHKGNSIESHPTANCLTSNGHRALRKTSTKAIVPVINGTSSTRSKPTTGTTRTGGPARGRCATSKNSKDIKTSCSGNSNSNESNQRRESTSSLQKCKTGQ